MRRKLWWILGAIAVIIIIVVIVSGGEQVPSNTTQVERGTVVSEVSVTGTVTPAQSIDLAFERSGRIASILVGVGSVVYRGQTLAWLENSDLNAQVEQAEATLAELERGARPEEIRAKELALSSAEATLEAYYEDAYNAVQDAFSDTSDAVRNKIDALFSGDESGSPQLTYISVDSQAEVFAKLNRVKAREMLKEWVQSLVDLGVSPSHEQIKTSLEDARVRMQVSLELFSNLQDTLTNPPGLSQTTLDSYKLNLATARSNVVSAITAVDNNSQLIEGQIIAVETAENNLALIRAGASEEGLAAQRAQVSYYRSQLGKTIISAQFAGTVTKVVYNSGEIVNANTEIMSLVGGGLYTIKANVTESDIAKVNVGKYASVTLDAYGSNEIFDAEVIEIDIGATIIEGVATYKTTLQFLEEDDRIRPGLTADVDILQDRKDDVLYIPTRNIISKNGDKFVKMLDNGAEVEVEITAGLRGSDGRTEIIEGLEEKDIILTD